MRWFPDPNQLLNNYEEIHAFVIGISHGFFFFQKHPPLTEKQKSEQHYYEQGKILGFIFFGVFIACLGKFILGG